MHPMSEGYQRHVRKKLCLTESREGLAVGLAVNEPGSFPMSDARAGAPER